MRSRIFPILLILGIVVAASALTSYLTLRLRASAPQVDYHQWIHAQLQLTAEQEQRLLPSEKRYEETRRHLEEVIRLANEDLARAIRQDKEYSPAVENAVGRIHNAMGSLQKATLEHIFEMREVLEPAQYERLIGLTVEGLSDNARRD